jgi:DNA-binding transcriptional regulator YhcF (GntR family)
MIVKLMLESDKPLYQQLKENILEALAKGELQEGEILPSVRSLSASLAINMHTVNKAYNQLADEGFVTMHKGKGAIINSKDSYAAGQKERESIRQSLSVIGAEAKCRSLSREEFLEMCESSFAQFEKESEK